MSTNAFGIDTGTTPNSITLVGITDLSGSPITALTDGLEITAVPGATNTGATTININSIGNQSIKSAGSPLPATALLAGYPAKLTYRATLGWFELLGPATTSFTRGLNMASDPQTGRGDFGQFGSRALASAATINAALLSIRFTGFTVDGDCEKHSYVSVADPGGALPLYMFRSADGRVWRHSSYRIQPQQFGYVTGSGVDATLQMQAVIDCVAARTYGEGHFPADTYYCGALVIRSGMKLRGDPWLTTFQKHTSLSQGFVQSANQSTTALTNLCIEDIIFDGGSGLASPVTESYGLLFPTGSQCNNVSVRRCGFQNCNGNGIAGSMTGTSGQFRVEDSYFYNLPNSAIIIGQSAKGTRGIYLLRNLVQACGGSIFGLHDVHASDGASLDLRFDSWFDVYIEDNIMLNLQGGTYGPIPIEVWAYNGFYCRNNYVETGTRGVGVFGSNFEISGNYFGHLSIYAIEWGNARNGKVHDNYFYRCNTGLTWDNNVGYDCFNCDVYSNTFHGTSLTAPSTGYMAGTGTSGTVFRNFRFRSNTFIDCEFVRGHITFSGSKAQPLVTGGSGSGAYVTAATYQCASVRVIDGGLFTAAPTLTPFGCGGTVPGLTPVMSTSGYGLLSASLSAGGSGGTNGTFPLILTGGTLAPGGGPALGTFTVSGGSITAISVTYAGLYSAAPTAANFAGSSGLTGVSATLITETFQTISSVTVGNPGDSLTSLGEVQVTGGAQIQPASLEMMLSIETVTLAGGAGYASTDTLTLSDNGARTSATIAITVSGGVPTFSSVGTAGLGFGRPSSVEVTDNSIYQRTYNSCAAGIAGDGGSVLITRNRMVRTAPFDTSHYSNAGAPNFIAVPQNAGMNGRSYEIRENDIQMLGTVASGAYLSAIGVSAAGAPSYGIKIKRNKLTGAFYAGGAIISGSTAGDTIVVDNDTDDVTSATIYNLSAAVVMRRITRRFSGGAGTAPTVGSWRKGDFVENEAPAISAGKVLLGYMRLTTGSNNVAGTDWTPVYATTS